MIVTRRPLYVRASLVWNDDPVLRTSSGADIYASSQVRPRDRNTGVDHVECVDNVDPAFSTWICVESSHYEYHPLLARRCHKQTLSCTHVVNSSTDFNETSSSCPDSVQEFAS